MPQYSISQKGREFHPGEISIKRGETIQIVNDDGDLLHHAYIDSPKFSFDSGDQEPGSVTTDITFTAAGDFDVLCAIHPKMKLTVHVKITSRCGLTRVSIGAEQRRVGAVIGRQEQRQRRRIADRDAARSRAAAPARRRHRR